MTLPPPPLWGWYSGFIPGCPQGLLLGCKGDLCRLAAGKSLPCRTRPPPETFLHPEMLVLTLCLCPAPSVTCSAFQAHHSGLGDSHSVSGVADEVDFLSSSYCSPQGTAPWGSCVGSDGKRGKEPFPEG